ncbi:MAG TPA: glycosyltransferase [Anaeromyxobacteraceae bacterium]|jgi:hypothetical protein|nr:glycosyltransferase [Anaeromyxobacteraceae bacterium]
MAQPWLSVVLPTYNGQPYVEQMLESVAGQELEGVEVIVADDGSTDGTLETVERYRERLSLKLVHRGGDGAWTAGSNRGLAEATGRYVSFLHQDDVWLPGRLARLRAELERGPDPVLLLHPVFFIDQRGRRVGRWRCPLPGGPEAVERDLFLSRLLVQNFVPFPGHVMQREAALRAGGFRRELWYTADWNLWLTLGRMGAVRYLGEPLACYRVHGSSLTTSRSSAQLREQMQQVLGEHLPHVADMRRRERVGAVARFAIEVNAGLAALAKREPARLGALLPQALALGPVGFRAYLRDSRIFERVWARLGARRLSEGN